MTLKKLNKQTKQRVCVCGGGGVELEEQVIMEEEKTSVRQNFIS